MDNTNTETTPQQIAVYMQNALDNPLFHEIRTAYLNRSRHGVDTPFCSGCAMGAAYIGTGGTYETYNESTIGVGGLSTLSALVNIPYEAADWIEDLHLSQHSIADIIIILQGMDNWENLPGARNV